ncbi:hypothetical protein MBLNU459_g0230t1 [Dothideomycetes sp. NU459]
MAEWNPRFAIHILLSSHDWLWDAFSLLQEKLELCSHQPRLAWSYNHARVIIGCLQYGILKIKKDAFIEFVCFLAGKQHFRILVASGHAEPFPNLDDKHNIWNESTILDHEADIILEFCGDINTDPSELEPLGTITTIDLETTLSSAPPHVTSQVCPGLTQR